MPSAGKWFQSHAQATPDTSRQKWQQIKPKFTVLCTFGMFATGEFGSELINSQGLMLIILHLNSSFSVCPHRNFITFRPTFKSCIVAVWKDYLNARVHVPVCALPSEKSNPQLKHTNGFNLYLVFQTTIIQEILGDQNKATCIHTTEKSCIGLELLVFIFPHN